MSTTTQNSNNRYPLILLGLYLILWIALAIDPLYRDDWLLENLLPALGLPVLWVAHRRMPLSPLTCITLFVFLSLHAVGAHYTYAEVPYDNWFEALTGSKLNALLGFERNHFDRLVHFLYGLLLFPFFWQVLSAASGARRGWDYLLITTFLWSHAGIYEIIEWAAAVWFGGDLGTAYLGTQGDEWDAQKDMALAMLGTAIALVILLIHERTLKQKH